MKAIPRSGYRGGTADSILRFGAGEAGTVGPSERFRFRARCRRVAKSAAPAYRTPALESHDLLSRVGVFVSFVEPHDDFLGHDLCVQLRREGAFLGPDGEDDAVLHDPLDPAGRLRTRLALAGTRPGTPSGAPPPPAAARKTAETIPACLLLNRSPNGGTGYAMGPTRAPESRAEPIRTHR